MIKAKDRKKLQRYFKDLEARGRAFEKKVLKDVAEQVRMDVMTLAPATAELGNYTAFLQSAAVLGDKSQTAVVYMGPTLINAKKLDPTETLIFMRDVKKKTPRNQEIFEALKLFEPYTTKTFPSNIKAKDFVLTWQKALPKDVTLAMGKNRASAPELAKKLKPLGIKVEKEQYEDPKKLQVLPDLPFQVLQHEMKARKGAKPHWIPALRNSQKKTFLKKILKDPAAVRILADPNYSSFRVPGKMALNVTSQSVQSLDDFMNYLQPKHSPVKEAKHGPEKNQ